MFGWESSFFITTFMEYCIFLALRGVVIRKTPKHEYIYIGLIYGISFLVNIMSFFVKFTRTLVYTLFY